MIKTKKQMFIVIAIFAFLVILGGTTYAWFNYKKEGANQTLIAGNIYLVLEEGNEQINLSNIFPETKEEARTRNDNYLTFEISGINESNKTLYYEIDINHGTDKSSPYVRFDDEDLRFDLVELDSNGDEVRYLLNNVGYDTLINKKIWVDTIESGSSTEVSKKYKLRMWLSEDVIISDSDSNANYPATGNNAFANHFASIRIKVVGDFQEKLLPGAFYQLAKNADTETLIDFGNISSSTNGEGLYRLYGTQNDVFPIYYYRGNIDNNNVLFGGYCWQIVRTTDTGGIKMIYNGLPDISGSGNNITYNCGTTRDIQDTIMSTTSLSQSTGYYYADDYEIVSTSGNSVTYRLKSKTNPITQVAIADATAAATNIPTIATNYPYTCKKTTETGTCTTLYKVDSYASGTNANVYSSLDRPIIGRSAFNPNDQSVSDVGYMSNTRYPYISGAGASGSIYGKSVEWNETNSNYLVIEDTAGSASTNTTKDNDHHYSCGMANTSSCSSVRYYYFNDNYITLTGGETIEDALYKMTGTGSQETKTKNASYILNQNNSAAKTAIDNWFRTNLTSEVNANNPNYSAYLEDTVYCNDRSFKTTGSSNTYTQSGWNPSGGGLTTYLKFGTHNRFSNSWYSTSNVPAVKNKGEVPNIACPNETDRFTVSSSNGNGALTYPVGLLTADEIILAGVGGNNDITSTYYLYTHDYYWSMAPYNFYYSAAGEFGAYYSSLNSNLTGSNYGLRPVVSLRLGTEFVSNGDGTATNPYVVKYN